MRLVNHATMFLLTVAAASAASAQDGGRAMLRVGCEGDSLDAAISINGEMRGQCPFDTAVPAGNLHIVAVKPVDDTHERRLERDLFMGAGTQKRLDIELPPAQLTPAARAAEDERKRIADEKARADAEESAKREALIKATEPYRDAARKATDPLAAEEALQAAEKIDPADREIHFLRAAFAAFGDDRDALERAIAEPYRRGWLSADYIGLLPDMDRWLKDEAFVRFLSEAVADPKIMARFPLLAAPAGRQVILKGALNFGPLSLTVAGDADGKGGYKRFQTRKITAMAVGQYVDTIAPGCDTTFSLGELVRQNPTLPVTLTWRAIGWESGEARVTGPLTIEVANAHFSGWKTVLIEGSSNFQIRWAASAMKSLHTACSAIARTK